MKQETAELLGNEGGEVRADYSGRCMYGETTHAVTFESTGDYERALVRSAYELGVRGSDDVEGVLSDLDNLRSDQMGLGIVVY
jgi:hypothetical protein